jgi:hypothetical protein
MHAPTEGAAAREVAASAAREMDEETAMYGVYPSTIASTRSGRASAPGLCGAWMAWRTRACDVTGPLSAASVVSNDGRRGSWARPPCVAEQSSTGA